PRWDQDWVVLVTEHATLTQERENGEHRGPPGGRADPVRGRGNRRRLRCQRPKQITSPTDLDLVHRIGSGRQRSPPHVVRSSPAFKPSGAASRYAASDALSSSARRWAS